MNIKKNMIIKVAVVVLLLLLPLLFLNNSYFLLLLCTSGIAIIVVSGLDLLFGYSGQISLGHAGFSCIGAYASTILTKDLGIPVLISMILASILACLVAVVIAFPAAKLVHHFLALITISFGELMHLFASHAEKLTGGFVGINFIPEPSIFGFVFDTNFRYYYLVLAFVLVLLLLKTRIVNSRTGRALIAIRENTHSSDGIGIPVRRYKILAFTISAFYAAIGGGLYAHLVGYISPESFIQGTSVMFLTMLLFGGMGNFWGSIVGAVTLTMVSEWLQGLGSYQMLVYGVFLLIIVVFIPSGVTRGRNPIELIASAYKKRREVGIHAENR